MKITEDFVTYISSKLLDINFSDMYYKVKNDMVYQPELFIDMLYLTIYNILSKNSSELREKLPCISSMLESFKEPSYQHNKYELLYIISECYKIYTFDCDFKNKYSLYI